MHLVARTLTISAAHIGGRAGKPTDLAIHISGQGEIMDLALRGEATPERVDVAIEKLAVQRDEQRFVLSAPARLRWQTGKALELGPAELSGELFGVKIPGVR